MTHPPRVFVTRRLPGPALNDLAGVCDLDVWEWEGPPDYDILRARTRNAEGLLCLLTDTIDEPLMDACPNLRVIANMAVGVDNIDLTAAAQRGIAVGNTPGVLTDATADLTMALILAASRRLPEGIAAVRDGSWGPWKPDWLLGLELHDAVLGIIGMGRIGQAVTRRAHAFGMEVIHAGRDRAALLRTVLGRSDVLSLHCPLTSDTRGLINADTIAQMKPGAILINTARGPIVDQRALAEALHDGHLAAAAIDVTDPEPLPPSDPLLSAPNLIVLPHLGSATRETRQRMAELAVANLHAGLTGRRLPYPVTPINSQPVSEVARA